MGSYFSRTGEDHETSNDTVDIQPSNAFGETHGRRPHKRRRLNQEKTRKGKDIPPPTRAMNNSRDNTTQKTMCNEKPSSDDQRLRSDSMDRRGNSSAVIKGSEDVKEADALKANARRPRKRKFVVFLGYNGEKYYGMQINPGVVTIERVLLSAFHKAGLISDENKESPGKVQWMRAARTDKGVSAIVQCVSAKLEVFPQQINDPQLIASINDHLPEDVQVYGILRPTGGFNARADCHRRRYEYIFPVRLLGGPNGVQKENEVGKGDPRATKLNSILKRFEGTHCFANFTDGLSGSDDASRRYMISLSCSQPFKPPKSGVFYVSVEIYGQSFLLHQIRKMIGLSLYVYHGHAPEETLSVALCPNVKIHTPMAPALGLLLENLIFDNYNKRFKDVLEQPISSDAFREAKMKFKAHEVYRRIAEKERNERVLETWVKNYRERFQYKHEEIRELHQKFVLSDVGKEEQRKQYVASLYPIKTSLSDFLDCDAPEMMKMATALSCQFSERYDVPPTFLARAPGRVNLIGEHLDYNGLPVIGVALRQGSMLAGCLDDTEVIEVQHVRRDVYHRGKLRADGLRMALENEDDRLDSDWIQYVSWGVKAAIAGLPKGKRAVSGGGRVLISGDLPLASGLASSSSLVTLSALATARLNRKRIPKQEIALRGAEGERIGAGTRGGAVDHAISMCASKGCAVHVSFTPRIAVRSLLLPKNAVLVAVGSNVKARKGFDELVKQQFNLRAAECRIAAAILARRLEVHLEKSVTTPGQLLFQAKKTSKLQCRTISTLREKALEAMPISEVVSLEDVKEQLGVQEVELQNRFLIGVKAETFAVGKRMSHVFSEAERVEQFFELLTNEENDDRAKLEGMGRILEEGHRSLRDYYESSCSEVDELVEFCLANGAVGSRVTGAGWGGFTISVVPVEKKDSFLKAVTKRVGKGSVIEVEPSGGACVLAIHGVLGGPDRKRSQAVADGMK
ncbi:tRNA pseudouridine synthase A, mitochondrial [Gracilariopsis chorda]|uniref:tRNA pseudouridine synthase A, mitochondrial n=1 Tax=Gracilariopsis chorda TaxID=448386 RepID=A0A2V3IFH2_9FLOR|nr:tRNA pseudouridine synthase A, mitochondrial [Gracilariopsis chorda]|eukprot:PXF40801.1 tRNA pseudouridine synthase A, mitochondrial [Gracilariopsis chorda]